MKKQFLPLVIFFFGISFKGFSQAGFTMDVSAGCAPLCVNFSDTATGALAWLWDFGDSQTSTQANPSHCYVNQGMYTITLIETFSSGPDTATGTVTVYPVPTAAFTYNVTGTNTVQFTDQSTGAVGWSWDFGDFSSSTQQNPSHTYATSGTYTVGLLAASNYGCVDTTVQTTVTVGIGDVNNETADWSIYPNPSNGKITIGLDENLKEPEMFRIENMLGENILSEEISVSKELDLSAQPAGIYFIRIGNSPAKKLVLQ